MRTTLTLEDALAERAKEDAARYGMTFKDVVNTALRIGLEAMEAGGPASPFRMKARPLGLREGLSYDNVAELLARGEGEAFR